MSWSTAASLVEAGAAAAAATRAEEEEDRGGGVAGTTRGETFVFLEETFVFFFRGFSSDAGTLLATGGLAVTSWQRRGRFRAAAPLSRRRDEEAAAAAAAADADVEAAASLSTKNNSASAAACSAAAVAAAMRAAAFLSRPASRSDASTLRRQAFLFLRDVREGLAIEKNNV